MKKFFKILVKILFAAGALYLVLDNTKLSKFGHSKKTYFTHEVYSK